MGVEEVTIIQYSCERCNHKWIPRIKTDELPISCPNCHSPYWNRPRKNKRRSK